MSAVLDAWQNLLASEHAAIFGYRRLGPHLTSAASIARARQDEAAHIDARDNIVAGLLVLGVTPVAATPDYPLSAPLSDAGAAAIQATQIERAVARAARLLVLAAADPTADTSLPSTTAAPASSTAVPTASTNAGNSPTQNSASSPSTPTVTPTSSAPVVDLLALRKTGQTSLTASTLRGLEWGIESDVATSIDAFPGT